MELLTVQFKAPKPTRLQRLEHYTVDALIVAGLMAATWLLSLGIPPA